MDQDWQDESGHQAEAGRDIIVPYWVKEASRKLQYFNTLWQEGKQLLHSLFYKNHVYKNIEAQISKKLRKF